MQHCATVFYPWCMHCRGTVVSSESVYVFTVVSWASAHSQVYVNSAHVKESKHISAHTGQNHDLCLSTHGHLIFKITHV